MSETIGVIGAGQMGAGIAQAAAASGRRVILADRELAIAEKARDGIAKRLARLVEKGELADAGEVLERIEPAAAKIARLISSRSVAASMTKAASAIGA